MSFTPPYEDVRAGIIALMALDEVKDGASASAISRLCGFARKSAVVTRILDELLDEGFLKQYEKKGVWVYVRSSALKFEEEVSEEACDSEEEEELHDDTLNEFNDNDLYVASGDLHGYDIKILSKGFKVTNPVTGKVYELPKTSRLLVINHNNHFEIRTPESFASAIQNYAAQRGFDQYCVSTEFGVPLGEITSNPQYYNACVIFATVSRHNKSGN